MLPAKAVAVMKDVGAWMRKNGESIYGTSAAHIGLGRDVVSTRKGQILYLHFINPNVAKIAFDPDGTVVKASCLDGRANVSIETTASGDAVVSVDRLQGCDVFDLVVKMVLK